MNGDIQTKDDRIRKVFEDQGIDISMYEDAVVTNPYG